MRENELRLTQYPAPLGDMVQGFYCGKPMPPQEAEKMLT